MSYISKEAVAAIRAALKAAFPKMKFSVVRNHSSEVSVSIMSGDVDFSPILSERGNTTLNPYRPYREENCMFEDEIAYQPFAAMFNKIVEIMKSQNWYDRSDAQTDYFDTAYYVSLSIGKWDKPYIQKA